MFYPANKTLMLKNCLLIVALLLIGSNLRSQSTSYEFDRINISSGLSNNQVRSIYKDPKGFVWFATLSGLNRYDGYQIKVFRHKQQDSTSISDDNVNRIFEVPGNKLLFDTHSGYNIYDPLTEKVDRNCAAYLASIQIPNLPITHLIKNKQGNFLFLLNNKLLYRVDVTNGRTIKLLEVKANEPAITSFVEDSYSNLWIVYGNGRIEKLDGKTGKVIDRISALMFSYPKELLNYSIFCDNEDDLWFFAATDARGVFHYDLSTGKLEHITKESSPEYLSSNIVFTLLQDSFGKIWIGTDHGGANVYDKTTHSFDHILNNVNDDKSISENNISAAYLDDLGKVWLGTYRQGVNLYQNKMAKFPLYRHIPFSKNGLQFNDVNDFEQDAHGNLWVGTNGGGLIYYNRTTGTYTQYLHDPKNANSLSNDVIVCLFMDRQQKLWIGTYYGGLECFDGKKFVHYRHNLADSNSISDDRIFEIFEDSEDNLWIGTLSSGLDRMDRQKNMFHHYKGYAENSVHAFYIPSIMEDDEGNIWVGSSNGIDVLQKKTGKFIYYSNYTNDPKGLSNNNIISLFQDSRGLIWVGTSDGLNIFDKQTQTFSAFRIEDGLPGNTVLTITEDKQKFLWISSPNGLSRIEVLNGGGSPANVSIACHNYNEQDGLQGVAFNENAMLRLRNGDLAFGGANGFNLFSPSEILPDKQVPKVVLIDAQLFNKSIGIGEKISGRILLPQAISEAKDITLQHDENVISFEFAALNYLHPEKNKYAYKLEGFNKDWVYTDGKIRKASYTNLDPGDYTFYVKAANSDGVWNEKPISLHLKILPPFWKSPVAYFLYFVVIALTLWISRRMIIQRAKLRFEIERQKQEAQRTHELDMMKIKFFTNVSHEFRTPLSLILSPLDKIVREANNPSQRKQLQIVHRNARRLLNLVNQLLDFRKMEVQELKLNPVQGDIIKFIRDIFQSFTDIAEKKNIQFSCYSTVDSLEMEFDFDKLERILFNLLSNAFKFTPDNGKVALQIQMEMEDNKQVLAIKVIDTGIGISNMNQSKIFDRFFQNDIPGSFINQGSGIGLSITKEFVKLHGGTIDVESELGKGSCFTVVFPVIEVPSIQNSEMPAASVVEIDEVSPVPDPGKSMIKKVCTLLIVEDNEDFLFYLKDNLKEYFNIIEAENGKIGWQKTLRLHPDLVIADVSMPELNGIDLCRKIKEDSRTTHIPVVLLTALAEQNQQIKGLEIGAADYITKPFNFEIMLSRVKNILEAQIRLRKTFQKQVDISPGEITIQTPTLEEQFIAQVGVVLEKNMSNADFSVEDMSKLLFMSRVTLYKKILSVTGKAPVEFIRSFRLQRAKQLLEKSQMTVSEVAYEVGFNSPKAFSKYFKAAFDRNPSSYLQKKKSEDNEV